MPVPNWWPEAHFGNAGAPLPRQQPAPEEPDDDRPRATPTDVKKMLGFDPAQETGFDD